MKQAHDPVPASQSSVDSLRELALDAKNNKRRAMLVLFVAVPIGVALLGGGWWYFGQQAAERDIAEAWSHASGCLVGAPLAAGERASLRMRNIQLTAVHAERDNDAETRWPSRCADHVAGLFEALRKHGRHKDGEDGVGAIAEPFAVALRKAEVMNDLSTQADRLFDAAAKMGLKAAPVSLQLPTPEPALGFNLDTLPESARISPHQYTLDSVTGTPMIGTEIHALVYDKRVDENPILCTFTRAGKDTCRQLGGELKGKSGLKLTGTVDEGASPLVLAGRRGAEGVYRSDGTYEQVTKMEVQSAYVGADGYVAVAGFAKSRDKGEFDLVEQAGSDAPPLTREIGPGDFKDAYQVNRTQLLWGRLMAQVVFGSSDKPSPRLTYAALPLAEEPKFTTVADLNWVNASIFGCRTKDTLVVGVGQRAGFVTFFENDAWTKPVPVDSLSPAVSCSSGEIAFTGSWGDQIRCTPAGCKLSDGVAPEFKPFKSHEVYWSELNGAILSVASTKRRGGVRFRHASGKNLDAPGGDKLLFDDHVKDNTVTTDSTLLGLLLAGRGDYAVVLVTTPKGVYALRFDADGKPKPAEIKRP